MPIKLTLNQIRLNLLVCLPLSSKPALALTASEIAELAKRANWITRRERLSVASRTDMRATNMLNNVVSHRNSTKNPIRLGLVNRDPLSGRLTLTAKGVKFLELAAKSIGATDSNAYAKLSEWLRKRAE